MDVQPKPLTGYRVVELGAIGPGPYCGQLLADLGADVIVVHRPGPDLPSVDARGKRSIVVDLRKAGAADIVLDLVETADVLIEGNRPGVAERLGVGPLACLERNPALIYGRMTGWGQTGPWAGMAGHDINYIALTGALLALGKDGEPPPPPLNLVGDFGGGSLFLALGIVSALLRAQKTGTGDIIDASILDGTSSMMGVVHSLTANGQWTAARGANLLDGGAPFYRCYRTSDHKFMAAGAIEPQFFARMLGVLGIDPVDFGPQNDPAAWPAQHRILEKVFASRNRDDWAALFDGVDACVTPVLDYLEAPSHPQNRARRSHLRAGDLVHPHEAPRFAGSSADWTPPAVRPRGADTAQIVPQAAGGGDYRRETADREAIAAERE
ncbi:CoA transferase [Rhizobium sp. DKSPLA3]|uniref:CoA transferase n=1 Tax=Rhizobium quercicola TaxID=2901226 RepID=A0A9X1SYZ6_9HYPH|nr:CaiB/BaiF CoA-transferase family protein [Rhizobium quercicola]MCD7107786.1 CoA transferase [Rhizobium quercicola]